MAGGLASTRISAKMTYAASTGGVTRYNAMETLRKDIDASLPGSFPYAAAFLYWEEVGTVQDEFLRNLLICGGCIVVLLVVLIPAPRVAIPTIIAICLSIFNTIGFLHFWDVTVNGVSTIYILICVGLAVDYSAHIAHVFNIETGSAEERAHKAMIRIGPSVFNACFSTFLAVVCFHQ